MNWFMRNKTKILLSFWQCTWTSERLYTPFCFTEATGRLGAFPTSSSFLHQCATSWGVNHHCRPLLGPTALLCRRLGLRPHPLIHPFRLNPKSIHHPHVLLSTSLYLSPRLDIPLPGSVNTENGLFPSFHILQGNATVLYYLGAHGLPRGTDLSDFPHITDVDHPSVANQSGTGMSGT